MAEIGWNFIWLALSVLVPVVGLFMFGLVAAFLLAFLAGPKRRGRG